MGKTQCNSILTKLGIPIMRRVPVLSLVQFTTCVIAHFISSEFNRNLQDSIKNTVQHNGDQSHRVDSIQVTDYIANDYIVRFSMTKNLKSKMTIQ